jgi:hypothetical protein
MLSQPHALHHVKWKICRLWTEKEAVVSYFKELYLNSSGGTEENNENLSQDSRPQGARTEHSIPEIRTGKLSFMFSFTLYALFVVCMAGSHSFLPWKREVQVSESIVKKILRHERDEHSRECRKLLDDEPRVFSG